MDIQGHNDSWSSGIAAMFVAYDLLTSLDYVLVGLYKEKSQTQNEITERRR